MNNIDQDHALLQQILNRGERSPELEYKVYKEWANYINR